MTFKKGKIVKFSSNMNEDEIKNIAGQYHFGVHFYEPGTVEFSKFGKNTCRLT